MKIEAKGVSKSFKPGRSVVQVLKGVDLTVESGSWVALLGASGSGKTTLLDIIGTLSKPDAGQVELDGQAIAAMSSAQLVSFRRKRIGFVFQAYHMMPELNVRENVMLPGLLDGMGRGKCGVRASELLEKVGLGHRERHRPNELSGGELQRAAIARCLMNAPGLILADEPTGNLDSVTGSGILDIFKTIKSSVGATIVMVTHDKGVAKLADRVVELKDGLVVG
jgi:ABC-type lipoprotein export system ATPase subunit